MEFQTATGFSLIKSKTSCAESRSSFLTYPEIIVVQVSSSFSSIPSKSSRLYHGTMQLMTLPFIICYRAQTTKNTTESEMIRPKTIAQHLRKQFNGGSTIIIMVVSCNHGIITHNITNTKWGFIKNPPRLLELPHTTVRRYHCGHRHNIWLGNFVEQVACVPEIVGLTVDINQAAQKMATGVEPRSYHMGMDDLGIGVRKRARLTA
uniref:Uncharacterized protein n=1 Tax=Opuntia streptacantha TaxID=393608 RepID=A0A7C8ZL76_OPUST